MIADLDIDNEYPQYGIQHTREVYAKTALLLFHPLHSQRDLTITAVTGPNSWWNSGRNAKI
jgi:hypothetical protein